MVKSKINGLVVLDGVWCSWHFILLPPVWFSCPWLGQQYDPAVIDMCTAVYNLFIKYRNVMTVILSMTNIYVTASLLSDIKSRSLCIVIVLILKFYHGYLTCQIRVWCPELVTECTSYVVALASCMCSQNTSWSTTQPHALEAYFWPPARSQAHKQTNKLFDHRRKLSWKCVVHLVMRVWKGPRYHAAFRLWRNIYVLVDKASCAYMYFGG